MLAIAVAAARITIDSTESTSTVVFTDWKRYRPFAILLQVVMQTKLEFDRGSLESYLQ